MRGFAPVAVGKSSQMPGARASGHRFQRSSYPRPPRMKSYAKPKVYKESEGGDLDFAANRRRARQNEHQVWRGCISHRAGARRLRFPANLQTLAYGCVRRPFTIWSYRGSAGRRYERFTGLKSLPALGALCIVSAHRFRRQFQPKFAYARLILDEKGRSPPAPGLSLTRVKALDQGATG